MGTPGKERQSDYRWKHPQLNVTFRNRDEYWTVMRALSRIRLTPRQVLFNWAQQVLANPWPSEQAGKPNNAIPGP